MRPAWRLLLVGTALLGAASLLQAAATAQATSAQAAPGVPSGTAELGGVVTSGDKAQPVRRAIVRITAPTLRGFREIPTDDAGRFHFTGLPAGRYTLTARKVGFVEATYGATRRRGLGTAIGLADGQKELAVRFPMTRGAVLGGTLTSPSGQPVYAVVAIQERTMVGGQITLTSAGTTVTDERGGFRFFDLGPGTYIVGVTNRIGLVAAPVTSAEALQWASRQASSATVTAPPASPMMTLAQTFYPGVRDASAAAPITLEAGAERLDVSFSLRHVQVSRVTGTLLTPDGRPVADGGVTLEPAEQAGGSAVGLVTPRNRATVNSRGEFEFAAVEPGRFVLIANGASGPRESVVRADFVQMAPADLWARESVIVDGRDVEGLVVRLQPKTSLTGRVVAEAGASPIDFATTRVSVSLRPRDGAGSPGVGGSATSVASGGAFTYASVTPWSYTVSASVSSGSAAPGAVPAWMVSSVTLGGRDVFDRYFDLGPGNSTDELIITVTNRPPSLSGKLTDEAGRPATDYFVVLVPADRSYWISGITRTPRAARPGNDGAFRFDTVAPGEYFIAAATDFDPREATEAAFLESLIERGMRVRVAAGQAAVQDLKVK